MIHFMNRRFLLYMVGLVLCLSISTTLGYDYLEGGYVRSMDRSSTMEPGIAGMVKWLDLPVPSSTFSPYREYYTAYTTTISPVASSSLGSPVPYDITGKTPYGVFYRNGLWLPYATYASYQSVPSNDLWISGQTNWTQYALMPVGATLQMLASVPAGGMGSLYEVVQSNVVKTEYKTAQFNVGYSSMTFYAGQAGRYMFYYVINNQPSNIVVIDVFNQAT